VVATQSLGLPYSATLGIRVAQRTNPEGVAANGHVVSPEQVT
jgi:hypothetical protein